MLQLPNDEEKRWQEVFAWMKQINTDVQRLQQRQGQTQYAAGATDALVTQGAGIGSAGGSIHT